MSANSERQYRFFRPADLLIPLLLVLFFVIQGGGNRSDEPEELVLEIHSGETVTWIPVMSDTVIQVAGNLGVLDVQISSGRARITRSPCPGQDCVKQGWISDSGDMAVCMPSGVYIVLGGGSEPLPDAVSY